MDYHTHCHDVLSRVARRAGMYNTHRWQDDLETPKFEYADPARPTPLDKPLDWWRCDWSHDWIQSQTERDALNHLCEDAYDLRKLDGRLEFTVDEWRCYIADLEVRRSRFYGHLITTYAEVSTRVGLTSERVKLMLDSVDRIMGLRERMGLHYLPAVPLTIYRRYETALKQVA